jgi:hypothetical protein
MFKYIWFLIATIILVGCSRTETKVYFCEPGFVMIRGWGNGEIYADHRDSTTYTPVCVPGHVAPLSGIEIE